MVLTELTTGLRCIEPGSLEIPPGAVPGCGDPDSGKTSPLEATSLLDRGRPFRGNNNERLIWRELDRLRVIGRVSGPSEPIQTLGFDVSRDGASARIPAQRRSHDPPVRVGEVRPHDSH
jgi:recombinational DNA repair ATPase RecF